MIGELGAKFPWAIHIGKLWQFFYRVMSQRLFKYMIALTNGPLTRALQKAIARGSCLGDATTEIPGIAEEEMRADVLTERDTKSHTRTRCYRDRG